MKHRRLRWIIGGKSRAANGREVSRRGGTGALLCLALLLSLLFPAAARPELKGENLLQSVPSGYKVGFQEKNGKMFMTEMVPQGESVEAWTEMVTTQVFLGEKRLTPQGMEAAMKKSWQAACPDSQVFSLSNGTENGYSYTLWLSACPKNPATGRPELTWIKAIKGNDSFYMVQKAFKFEPDKAQIERWMRYLRTVTVCDTRLDDRPCPQLGAAGQGK